MLVRRACNSQTKQFTGKVFLSFSTKNNFMQLPLRAVDAEIMEIFVDATVPPPRGFRTNAERPRAVGQAQMVGHRA